MNELTIKEQYKKIIFLLDNRQLTDAFIEINSFIADIPNWELRSSLEEVQTSYQYMLKYMVQGIVDPERTKLYHHLVNTLYSLTDRARIILYTQISTGYFYDRSRYFNHIPLKSILNLRMELESYTEEIALKKLISEKDNSNEYEVNELRKLHEKTVIELFYRTWVSGNWSETEEIEANDILNSMLISTNDLSSFISAVTLSLTENFDIRKLIFLFNAYQHSSNEINQRAILGLAMIIPLYDNRLSLYPEIAARIELLNEIPQFAKNLLTIQIQLLRSRETEKIDKKMREEIIPEMVKNMNRINKFEMDEPDEEGNSDDMNPDWEGWSGQSGLSDKLKEMSDLQMEGADVYMSTFSQLKRYPFFNEMSNWFYPFDRQHSSIAQILGSEPSKQQSLLNNLLQSAFFCNSDKYSFCFTIMQVPEAQRSMMIQQLEEQNANMNENEIRDQMQSFAQRAENISNQYVHDLYRFYKIFPRRNEFWNPFQPGIDLNPCNTLKKITRQAHFMRTQANFLFQKEYYFEAYILYNEITEEFGGDAELYQKTGYCLQRNRNFKGAIEAYLNADLNKPDNIWTNHHLAICYRQTGQYEKALEYYRKVESVQPENLKVVTQTGLCLAKLKRYEEALAYFFKVEYLNGSSAKIWRAIGWCSFVSDKQEQAMKYYNKLIDNKEAKSQDYFNAGHVAWISGDLERAVKLYVTCRKMAMNDDEFIQLFNEDKTVLITHGIKEEDIPLMRDLATFNYRNT